MHWNYRVIRYHDGFLRVVEVYYENCVPTSYCPSSVCGDTPEELEAVLEQHRMAMWKPVLNESTIFSRADKTSVKAETSVYCCQGNCRMCKPCPYGQVVCGADLCEFHEKKLHEKLDGWERMEADKRERLKCYMGAVNIAAERGPVMPTCNVYPYEYTGVAVWNDGCARMVATVFDGDLLWCYIGDDGSVIGTPSWLSNNYTIKPGTIEDFHRLMARFRL